MVPDAAKTLHEKGREAGQRGDLSRAVALSLRPPCRDPQACTPYTIARSRIFRWDTAAALADYRRTLELSPRGFFTAHVAVDALRREQKGELPAGFYLAYVMLEFMPDGQRRQVIPQLVERFPAFAPAWLEFAKLASAPRERLDRIEAGLRARPDPETRGMLQLNQALTLGQSGQDAKANRIIAHLAADPGSTSAVEAWAKVLLAKKDR